ncbi:MAG: hypothetical protein HY648_01540 [Acidobacteria bacterium]|nr:hypothetical protein [Acidobacteriota bacterium]
MASKRKREPEPLSLVFHQALEVAGQSSEVRQHLISIETKHLAARTS